MLIGSFEHSLDKKGRAFIPAKFRDELGETIIVCQGIGSCLFLFSEDGWKEFAGKLRQIPMTEKKAQQFLRVLFASASECVPDKQGRIVIPMRLREYAGMQDEIVANGVYSRVELWSREGWDKYCTQAQEGYDEALEILTEFGV